MGWSEDAARNRDVWTRANAQYTDEEARRKWAADEITWGVWDLPESELQILGDVDGLDVVELGCGTAYLSAWLAQRGARPIGVDVTPAQLDSARRLMQETGIEFPLVEADAAATGLPDASADLVVTEYGASIWVDPYRWIPQAARLLRPGGRLVFLRNSTLAMLCAIEDGPPSETLQRPQRGLHRLEWEDEDGEGIEFQLGHGDWFRVLRDNGFDVVDLVELFATENTPDQTHYTFSREWAERWPFEEIWRARLRTP